MAIKHEWTLSKLKSENEKISQSLGVSLIQKSKKDVLRFIDFLQTESHALSWSNHIRCQNDEDVEEFESILKLYQENTQERKLELLEQISDMDLAGHHSPIYAVIKEWSIDSDWKVREMVEEMLIEMPPQNPFESLIDLIYSPEREDIKQGLVLLQDLNVFRGYEGLMKQVVQRLVALFTEAEDRDEYIVLQILETINKHQNKYPDEFKKAGRIYIRSLDTDYFEDSVTEKSLHLLLDMSFELMQKLDETVVERLAQALEKIVKSNTSGNSSWVASHVIEPLKVLARRSQTAQNALDWFEKNKD